MLIHYKFIALTGLLLCSAAFSKDINISDRGAIGDGNHDNWQIFQTAIDEIAQSGGGTLSIPAGEFAIYDKSLVIWGDNIHLKGAGSSKSIIIKKGIVGYFGDAIDIVGKANGYQYYGNFGVGNYAQLYPYKGENIPANNIKMTAFQLKSQITPNSRNSQAGNNLGIMNSNNVVISDCIVADANQTNVAIVNVMDNAKNGLISFNNCEFRNSGTHNFRVISYNSNGSLIGNNVVIENSRFVNVMNQEQLNKEISGKKIHLWYRGAVDSDLTSLTVKNSSFDNTGIIIATQSARNLNITNSKIDSSIEIKQVPAISQEAQITIENNQFKQTNNFQANAVKSMALENDNINNFITLYPKNLNNSPAVQIKDNQLY